MLISSAKCLNLQMIPNFARELRNPDDIMELQEDINKLVKWTNKWQMSFNVDKCSVMHIGHNNMKATITCPINSCRQQINSRI